MPLPEQRDGHDGAEGSNDGAEPANVREHEQDDAENVRDDDEHARDDDAELPDDGRWQPAACGQIAGASGGGAGWDHAALIARQQVLVLHHKPVLIIIP